MREVDSISGPRLTLRPWDLPDAPRVEQVMADASMHEFLALPRPYTLADAVTFVTGNATPAQTGIERAVVQTSTGEVVGAAALRLGSHPDIGYWVAPDARGHGYAAEATRLLATVAFDRGVPRVELVCDVRNLASARTALRAGFAFEGVARSRVDGEHPAADVAVFARLPEDSGDPLAHAFADLPTEGLHDDKIILRIQCADDAEALVAAEDAVARAVGFGGPARTVGEYRVSAARAGLDALVGTQLRLAVIDTATDATAGSISLRRAGPPQVGGIGYGIHPAFRGRGYAGRALTLLAGWAFDTGDFARLELGAKVSNVASQRTALAAGFVADGIRAGRLRTPHGTFVDEARFALLNPRYR